MTMTTDNPDQGKSKRGRGGNGRFVRTDDTAVQDAEACRLRSDGVGYQEIADRFGYANASSAWKAVNRALKATVAEPAARLRALELLRLDAALIEAFKIMRADHVAHSNGRVIMDPADPTKPLLDPGPKLQAIDKIVKVSESRRKLIGMDAPMKVDLPTAAQVEAEIARRAAELGIGNTEGDEQ
ncbi:hypothetical protein ACQEVZ_24795 [Dactylosporangium sp. CA-152071]|uniref:hypothetical protein n=1 Tax=Dactylosporangium sp. CA-152071 TaxID=3239933 RepID=UPI003D8BE6CD